MVAATNVDLDRSVAEQRFRQDLYYRLSVIVIRIPALRDRREDIPMLIEQFMRNASARTGRSVVISPEAVLALTSYRWPGNVRELENLGRRLAALYPQEMISAAVVEAELSQPAPMPATDEPPAEEGLSAAVERHLATYFAGFREGLPPPGLYHRILREIEHPLLTVTLAATRGNQIRAADLLGVNRNTLRKKIRDLEIQVFRSGG